jgi:hypothetical protein
MMKFRRIYIKLANWEYWPFQLVYAPIFLYWLWLSLKARSLFFFSTSNPLIENAGFALERKSLIYQLIPKGYYPDTVLCDPNFNIDKLRQLIMDKSLNYPLIGKPDVGQRGIQVKLIRSAQELQDYARQIKVNFLLQEYIDYEQEAGIFYYRLPGEGKGHISGIVGKEFLSVLGDGVSTIRELILKNQRYLLQLPVLEQNQGAGLNEVLEKGISKTLVPYGNHSRGALFLDLSHLITDALTLHIDQICRRIPEFYFGRLDIKYQSWEALCQGKQFSIIELNGAGSEPTHIYDPKHSIFFAWAEIIRHWNLLYRISSLNSKKQGLKYMNYKTGMAMIRGNADYIKLIS